jgi:hypothetical protein
MQQGFIVKKLSKSSYKLSATSYKERKEPRSETEGWGGN